MEFELAVSHTARPGEGLPSAIVKGQCQDMNQQSSFSMILVITGDELDPELVTKIIGIDPDQSWRKGDQRRIGESVHTYRWGGWKLFDPPGEKYTSFQSQLNAWSELISKQSVEYRRIADLGWHACLDCYLILSGASDLLDVGPEVMKSLGDAGIFLQIAISSDRDSELP